MPEISRFFGMKNHSKIIEAKYAGDYVFTLRFADGVCGNVDFEKELWGEMFEPLKDKEIFATAKISADFPNLVWANGADFAPEFLYAKAKENILKG